MTILVDDDYSLATAGQLQEAFNPYWGSSFGGATSILATTSTPRGMRVQASGVAQQRIFDIYDAALTSDFEYTYSLYWASFKHRLQVQHIWATGHNFSLEIGTEVGIVLDWYGSGAPGRIYQNAAFSPAAGSTTNVVFRFQANKVTLHINGALVFTRTQTLGATNPNRFRYMHTCTGLPTQDGLGLRVTKFKAEMLSSVSDLTLTPVYSQFYTVTPTLIGEGFLNPNAVYSEFRTVTPALVAVTYPLNVTPVSSQFYTLQPILLGDAATFDAPAVYSEWRIVQPLLATGAVLEPQPVYSEWYAVDPELIPGPVDIELTPVYSEWQAALPTLAMALTLNPNPVYSEWYVRRPTLKSRFDCCTIPPLQDRAHVRTVNGSTGYGVGVLGSDQLVRKIW